MNRASVRERPALPGDVTAPVVRLGAVWRSFGTDPPVHALRGVDLVINPGEWMTIVGPSGSGKSTLLNVLGLLDRQTAGSYHCDGVDVATLDDLQRAGLRGVKIGFVFQAFHLLPHRSVLENVMLAEIYRGTPARVAGTGRSARSTGWGWEIGRASWPRACPVVSGSGRPSPAHSSATRGCCSATSRPGTSIHGAPTACWRSSTSSRTTA